MDRLQGKAGEGKAEEGRLGEGKAAEDRLGEGRQEVGSPGSTEADSL